MTDSQNETEGQLCDFVMAERTGRLAAEERLARIRHAISGETWSQAVCRWRVATFGIGTLERSLERALEEFDEMISELGCCGPDGSLQPPFRFSPDFDPKKVAKEAADFCIALSAFIGQLGFDLAREIEEKHRINSTERQWISNRDGTGYHVKPLDPNRFGSMTRSPELKKFSGNMDAEIVEVQGQFGQDADFDEEIETD